MPIYIFHCEECKKEKELLKSFSQFDEKEFCETCQKEMVKKLTTASFHLKGSGFYQNDYKKKT